MTAENELILKEIRELKEQVSLNCSKLDGLQEQVSLNCSKLDTIDKKISEMQEQVNSFYTAFGREINRIESHLKMVPYRPE